MIRKSVTELEAAIAQAPSKQERVDALNSLAERLWSQDLPRSLELSQQAQAQASADSPYQAGLAAALMNLAKIQYRSAQYDQSHQNLLQALTIYQALAQPLDEASAWTGLGTIYWRLADYATATEYHLKAIAIYRAHQAVEGEASALTNLGVVYGVTGDYATAIETYQQLLDIYRANGDRKQIAVCLNNLAMASGQANNLTDARQWAKQGLQLARQEQNTFLETQALDTNGYVCLAAGDAEEARRYFLASAENAQMHRYLHEELAALLNLGKAHTALREPEAALTTWQQALTLAKKIGAKEEQRDCHWQLAQHYKKEGDPTAALDHFEQFHALEQAIYNETADMRLKTLQVVHATEKARIKTAVLEQELAERHRIEAVLRASQEDLQTMIRATPDSVFFKDGNGRWLVANQAGLDLFHLRNIAYQGLTDIELAEHTPFFRDALHYCARTDEDTWQNGRTTRALETIPQPDGSVRFYDAIKTPLYHADGTRKGLVIIGRDVTVEKQQEIENQRIVEALRLSEERLRQMVQSMPVMINAFDKQGQFVFWNKECERVTGYKATEIIGNPDAFKLLYPDPAYLQQVSQKFNELTNEYRNLEWQTTCKDGSQKIIAWSNISANFPLPGWTSWEIGIDVTERQRAEAALRQTQKTESLGILAGGIAHDFNNLLVAILGQMSLAQIKMRPESQARTHVDKAVRAAERAADLTQKMLAYSGRGHFSVQPLNLNAIISDNLHLFQASLPKNVRFEANLAPHLPLIDADAGQMQQVVMNLIINGAEALGQQPGRVLVVTRVETLDETHNSHWHYIGTQLPSGTYVALEVHDPGEGMDKDTLPKIFDPFFTTKPTGHGLGLAAVLGIMRGHRGGIFVSSEPKRGTTFKLTFPISNAEREPIVETTAVSPFTLPLPLVLVIDDEEPVCMAISDILDSQGIRTLAATNGQSGIELYQAYQDDIYLIILDLSMPGLNGEQTFRKLHQINPDVRVLLSSGYNQAEAIQRFDGKELTGFIQKPYSAITLIKKVQQILLPG